MRVTGLSSKLRAAALAAVVLGVLLTGCGGGGSSGTTGADTSDTGGPLTKADWIEEADAVCGKALRDERPIATEASPELLTKGRALLQRLGTELEAIPVPPDQMAQIDRLMRALSSTVGLMEAERRRTGGSGNLPPLEMDRVLTAVGAPVSTMAGEFSRYGARSCGEVDFGFPSG